MPKKANEQQISLQIYPHSKALRHKALTGILSPFVLFYFIVWEGVFLYGGETNYKKLVDF